VAVLKAQLLIVHLVSCTAHAVSNVMVGLNIQTAAFIKKSNGQGVRY